jgi:hypothetical protein
MLIIQYTGLKAILNEKNLLHEVKYLKTTVVVSTKASKEPISRVKHFYLIVDHVSNVEQIAQHFKAVDNGARDSFHFLKFQIEKDHKDCEAYFAEYKFKTHQ